MIAEQTVSGTAKSKTVSAYEVNTRGSTETLDRVRDVMASNGIAIFVFEDWFV